MTAETLTELYVLVSRLHGSLRFADVVAAVHEVLGAMIGTEHFALFVRDDGSGRYEPVSAVGASLAALPSFRTRDELRDPVAAVALAAAEAESPIGFVVIYKLLAHRGPLDGRDRTLLDELGRHGGHALAAALLALDRRPPTVRTDRLRALLDPSSPVALDPKVGGG